MLNALAEEQIEADKQHKKMKLRMQHHKGAGLGEEISVCTYVCANHNNNNNCNRNNNSNRNRHSNSNCKRNNNSNRNRNSNSNCNCKRNRNRNTNSSKMYIKYIIDMDGFNVNKEFLSKELAILDTDTERHTSNRAGGVASTQKGRGERCDWSVGQKPLYPNYLVKRLQEITEQEQTIISEQFGFKKGKSTKLQLGRIIGHKRQTFVTTLDLSKAYDRVRHAGLIQKMANQEIPRYIIRIMLNYIKDRKMFVQYKDNKSVERQLQTGLPQGSYLSLILRDSNSNDSGENTHHHQKFGKLKEIEEFAQKWKMKDNPRKTEATTRGEWQDTIKVMNQNRALGHRQRERNRGVQHYQTVHTPKYTPLYENQNQFKQNICEVGSVVYSTGVEQRRQNLHQKTPNSRKQGTKNNIKQNGHGKSPTPNSTNQQRQPH
ncbi:myb-like protein P [Aethina tumida]|uniref:myb-like protein P n=1 Tax=Aethina tumida TaxID=116153 RepID=UPI002148692D|nr:myb-like protein P [Aethina tumida]